ncbi:arsenate reductase [Altererythrobacter sp. BO-6]|uniref:arsenate reductase n=1 Tax=Altererythrobacter sp. BO-6 TaxID=2604537 RepID=UPI0013E15592|nr:arsenate reductase [Altererythrobacter sp. BO-6]QIG54473.1 arsenate reductase [Altererythrobacter sp. BO-6]
MIHLYGIPNCDTVKKARSWLEARGLEYIFHDYKKEGADPARVANWVEAKGLDLVLNRRGTTFRKLSDADKAAIGSGGAVSVMVQQPSLIKRPVAEHDGGILVGFKQAEWEAVL